MSHFSIRSLRRPLFPRLREANLLPGRSIRASNASATRLAIVVARSAAGRVQIDTVMSDRKTAVITDRTSALKYLEPQVVKMSEPRRRWLLQRLLIAGVLILAFSALALFGLFILFIANPVKFDSAITVASRKAFVGTWVGERGNILNFRADGTARTRFNASDQEFDYFEWTASHKELDVFLGPRRHNLRWTVIRIQRFAIGGQTTRYKIEEMTPDQFQLLDPETGKLHQFKRTNDTLLEAAP